MPVKFLSDEWAQALKGVLNGDESFRQAAGTASAKLQQVITSADGEKRYWITIAGGQIDMGVGEMDSPDATIRQSYDTAVALANNQLSPVTAFMTGKIQVVGNMGLLLGLQAVLSKLPAAMQSLDVAY